ncbi:MAG: hypothetical protein GVY24_08215 [Planctomycetes bacterium]|nr:hypothetical protein [Planctomycetota bacterium]
MSCIESDENTLPDFRGRTVCVFFMNRPANEGRYLIDPYFKLLAGRLYLIGNLPSPGNLAHREMGVAWDRVESYIVADSLGDFSPEQAADKLS